MNKLLFILLWAALVVALYFPVSYGFSPKGGIKPCRQDNGIFLAEFAADTDYATNLTASFSVPWNLTLAVLAPGGVPREGELWVRVTDPENGELCLERLTAFKDAAPVEAFNGEPSLGLTFTFVLDDEEDVKKIDPVNGPFFLAEGQKGVLPGKTYDWEIGLRGSAAFYGSLWLTAREVSGRSLFLARYTKTLAWLYSALFALIISSLIWLWHAGSMYRFIKNALPIVLLLCFSGLCAEAGSLTFATPEAELIESCELLTSSANGGTLLSCGELTIFSKGAVRIMYRPDSPMRTLPLAGNCSLAYPFLEAMAKGETYSHKREDCQLSALAGIPLEENSLVEITRHLGPPALTGTGSCHFAAWTFTDGSSLFAAYEGDKCYRFERQPNDPEYYLDLKRYGGQTPEWAKWPWRYFHMAMLGFLALVAVAVMVRAMVFGKGIRKLLKTKPEPKEES